MTPAAAGFNTAAIGFNPSAREMALRGRGFWGPDLEEGTRVNIQKAQTLAQDRYLGILQDYPGEAPILPVVDLIDPDAVRKAIFAPGYKEMEHLYATIEKAAADLWSEVEDALTKATTTNSNLMHSISDSDVTLLFKKVYPAQTLIPVEVNRGKIAQWDAIPPNGAGSAFFGSEDPELVESDMTDYTRTATCKIMYSTSRVTKMAMIAGQSQVPARDLMGIRAMGMAEMLKNLRERSILGVTRDVTVANTSFTAAGPLEYAGLHELVTANTASPNYVDVSGSTVDTIDKIQPYLDETYMRMIQTGLTPDLALTDYKTFGIYRRGLNDFFHTENAKFIEFGVAKINLVFPGGEVPMVPVPFLPSATGTNGTIKLFDTTHLARRVLWAETYEELANLNTSKRGVTSASEVPIDKTDVNGTSSLQCGVEGISI